MDILVRPVDRIVWNTTTWVEAVEEHMGGNGASTSYAAAVCGTAVRLVSVAGRDAFGDRLLGELAAAGVDVAHVRRSDGPTGATVALVNSAGDRAFLHRIGAGAEAFDPPGLDAALSDGMSRFHMANLFSCPACDGARARSWVVRTRPAWPLPSIRDGTRSAGGSRTWPQVFPGRTSCSSTRTKRSASAAHPTSATQPTGCSKAGRGRWW